MEFIEVDNFDLKETIYSGQFFNFKDLANSFIISNGLDCFEVKQEGTKLYYKGISEEKLKLVLGLDFDLDILKDLNDKYFQKAYSKYKGLRIMNCDLFQTIISFICSAAANQKKIETNIRGISKEFGEYVEEFDFYKFPRSEEINDLDKLLITKVGYRGKFILETSIMCSGEEGRDFLSEIENSDYHNAHKLLMKFPGVGSKVADCICLFALNHFEAFPVDTWIKKMVKEWYGFEGNQKQMEVFVKEHFGDLGGYYQQYLFHLLRDEGL